MGSGSEIGEYRAKVLLPCIGPLFLITEVDWVGLASRGLFLFSRWSWTVSSCSMYSGQGDMRLAMLPSDRGELGQGLAADSIDD